MTKPHYVNNSELLAALIDRKSIVEAAKAAGLEKPQLTNYIAESILKISNHLAYRPNFNGYSYKDEMISDGVETCLRYIDNFDPSKGSNPFAYLTQICWFSFIRRISLERGQSYIKHKLIKEIPIEYYDLQHHDEDGEFTSGLMEILQSNNEFDTTFFDNKIAKIKAVKLHKKTPLEEVLGD